MTIVFYIGMDIGLVRKYVDCVRWRSVIEYVIQLMI